ncbi:MAG: PIG-L family deacetylase [Acidobacteriota bacterium]|nr:MAG: PIG-L family deacetylase [Acidobacteriota bacterium]
MRHGIVSVIACLVVVMSSNALAQKPPEQIRVLVIGAHPDDPDWYAGGTAKKFVEKGHIVRLLSLTNGNAGHFEQGGAPLAQRRFKEAQCAGQVIGAEYVVLDNDDGKLLPTLENREEVIRQIRSFRADLVLTHRPNDYHPDHRNTGLLVRDAAYMVTVPNIVAGTPHLRKNPVFAYLGDHFTKPSPIEADVAVDIDDVIERKLDMFDCHDSQFYEWLPYNENILDQVPEGAAQRRAWLAKNYAPVGLTPANTYRDRLKELYGSEKGAAIKYAEVFEISEYGTQPSADDLKLWFPFYE